MKLKNSKKVSIIIRTKNEEKWLSRCLTMVYSQIYTDFEVIVIDNLSTDGTTHIAKTWDVDLVLSISEYTPGKALNYGISQASGVFIVILSAHCVPVNEYWLNSLVEALEANVKTIAVYGRQIPLPYSSEQNSRDLLSVFRNESREQVIDYFFHNANSALKKEIWKIIPFDETTISLEDQIWAKSVLNDERFKGHHIFYNPNSMVYHHDGLHFNESVERTNRVVSVLRDLNKNDLINIPMYSKLRLKSFYALTIFDDLSNLNIIKICVSNYVQFIKAFQEHFRGKAILICSVDIYDKIKIELEEQLIESIIFIERDELNYSVSEDQLNLMKKAIQIIPERYEEFPEGIFFYNPQYPTTSDKNFANLIDRYSCGDYDIVMIGKRIKSTTWIKDQNGNFLATEGTFKPSKKNESVYETYLGAGTIISPPALLRSNLLESRKIQIIETIDTIVRMESEA